MQRLDSERVGCRGGLTDGKLPKQVSLASYTVPIPIQVRGVARFTCSDRRRSRCSSISTAGVINRLFELGLRSGCSESGRFSPIGTTARGSDGHIDVGRHIGGRQSRRGARWSCRRWRGNAPAANCEGDECNDY